MSDATQGEGPGERDGMADRERLALLEARVRYLQERLARYEPGAGFDLDDLMDGPQRQLSPAETASETTRLVAVCAERGVEAVLADVATCRELLRSLADACHRAGLHSACQYLRYLELPYD